MKLEALFKSKDNKLVRIADEKEISLENLKIYKSSEVDKTVADVDFFAIEIPWSTIEIKDGIYNEEFLANLREFLKKAEGRNQTGIIIPVIDKDYSSDEKKEAFTDAFNHTARRIKDCVSVVGFKLSDATVNADQSISFMETLAKKHAQYLYFVKSELLPKVNQVSEFGIIAY